jgi:hypothetical protein
MSRKTTKNKTGQQTEASQTVEKADRPEPGEGTLLQEHEKKGGTVKLSSEEMKSSKNNEDQICLARKTETGKHEPKEKYSDLRVAQNQGKTNNTHEMEKTQRSPSSLPHLIYWE